MVQSSHNFTHATTAQLSRHVQNYDLIVLLELKLEQNEFQNILIMSSLIISEIVPRSTNQG